MSTKHLLNPITLLKLEYAKFKSYAVVNFLLGLGILLFPIALLSIREVINDVPPPLPSTSIVYEFPTIWDYTGYIGSWLVWFFFGCTLIFTVTSEVTFKTQRQNIISGYTRQSYFFAKALNVLFLSVVATIVYSLTCLIIGFVFSEDAYFSLAMDNNFAIIRFFFMSMGYLSLALLIAMFFRKNGLAVFVYVAYALVFEYIIRGLHMFGLLKLFGVKEKFTSAFYWPINAIEDNMPFPLMRMEQFLDADMPFNLLLEQQTSFLLTILYILLFFFLAYRIFMKNDI